NKISSSLKNRDSDDISTHGFRGRAGIRISNNVFSSNNIAVYRNAKLSEQELTEY
ncbi:unnamed protein product, partial [Rotaria sp. Silwood1]